MCIAPLIFTLSDLMIPASSSLRICMVKMALLMKILSSLMFIDLCESRLMIFKRTPLAVLQTPGGVSLKSLSSLQMISKNKSMLIHVF